MAKCIVKGLKTKEIREYANKIRRVFSIPATSYVNMPKLLDQISIAFSKLGLKFNYEVREDQDEIFDNKEEAFTNMTTGVIYFKRSVIENACRRKYNRGAFTIAHELGHYFLHYLQLDSRLSRVSDEYEVPVYRNPEWQANTFASELLMPYERCLELDEEMIRKTYHVSREAASTRKRKITNEANK